MRYFRTISTANTVNMDWNCLHQRHFANQKIGPRWQETWLPCAEPYFKAPTGKYCESLPPGWSCAPTCSEFRNIVNIKRINFENNRNDLTEYPYYPGKIQYRAYNCIPRTYQQLMGGVLINPKKTWNHVRQGLLGSKVNDPIFRQYSLYVYVVAFFIPSNFDRIQRRIKPTFSEVLGTFETWNTVSHTLVLHPPCPQLNNIFGNLTQCDIKDLWPSDFSDVRDFVADGKAPRNCGGGNNWNVLNSL